MEYKDNWCETQKRFEAWWNNSKIDRPLMKIVARRKGPIVDLCQVLHPKTPKDAHMDVEYKVKEYRNFCRKHIFMADAFPFLDVNIGPGSLAAYLGSEPIFDWKTVWYKECIDDWGAWGKLEYDENNRWYQRHLEAISLARELSNNDFPVCIPDILENVDILSAMRGPQQFCFDLLDEPDVIKSYIQQVDELYFRYYDAFYDITKSEDGSSWYTAFSIWGEGKTAKIQCDFSALMSPSQFREFVLPSLQKQCKNLNHSLYHLDGPDAVRHLDAIMEIEELDALQWTPGAGNEDGGSEKWYPIYEKVKSAGKALWISVEGSGIEEWIEKSDKIVKRFGAAGLYLLFPIMEEEDAQKLLLKAEKCWR